MNMWTFEEGGPNEGPILLLDKEEGGRAAWRNLHRDRVTPLGPKTDHAGRAGDRNPRVKVARQSADSGRGKLHYFPVMSYSHQ